MKNWQKKNLGKYIWYKKKSIAFRFVGPVLNSKKWDRKTKKQKRAEGAAVELATVSYRIIQNPTPSI